MSTKRPGVDSSTRLSKIMDVKLWEKVESQFAPFLASVKEMEDCNTEYEGLRNQFSSDSSKDCISKEELMVVVRWKFSVGKKRAALMKHLNSNTDKSVQQCSKKAIAHARRMEKSFDDWRGDDFKTCINHLTELSGVGPATASAVLSMIRPDVFPYMYDECIDTFLPKRTYTLPVYLQVAKSCTELSKDLKGWSPARIARTLWIAARVCASKGDFEDFTLQKDKTRKQVETANTSKRSTKRRRRS